MPAADSPILPGPFFLSPMSRYTNRPARTIAREFGADLVYTEMLVARDYLRGSDEFRSLADFGPNDKPIAAQIASDDVADAVDAAQALEERGFDMIEINMSCPKPSALRRGIGGVLLRDVKRAVGLLKGVVNAVKCPVTAKIRHGWAPSQGPDVHEFVAALADAGAVAIVVHPRWVEQQFRGPADWDVLSDVVERAPCPIWGTGDVRCATDGVRMLREVGCAAVGFARWAVGNPWLFREAHALLRGDPLPPPPSDDEVRGVIARHIDLASRYLPMPHGRELARRALHRYAKRLSKRRPFLEGLSTVRTEDEWAEWMHRWGLGRAVTQ